MYVPALRRHWKLLSKLNVATYGAGVMILNSSVPAEKAKIHVPDN
jgi:hypothetical protein